MFAKATPPIVSIGIRESKGAAITIIIFMALSNKTTTMINGITNATPPIIAVFKKLFIIALPNI
jgi:hypothetical protein